MADLRHRADAFEAAATDKTLTSEDFLRLGQATTLAAEELPPFTASEPDVPQGADLVAKLRALVEVHGAREQFYFSDPQTKADLHALLPGLDEVGLRELVLKFVGELNSQQTPQVVSPKASREREILTALFRAAGGDNWYRHDNWDTDAELSTWHGVKVNGQGRVVELLLAKNNLQGAIPPVLCDLGELAHLDLSTNELCGAIPAQLGNLTALTSLDLGHNKLNGVIPRQLGELRELRILRLGRNQLAGAIPPELGRLTALELLRLDGNRFTGPVPEALEQLCLDDSVVAGENASSSMANLRREADAFEAAAKAKTLSSEDFRRLGDATARAEQELPPLAASEPDSPQGADIVAKLRALVEVHGAREHFYFTDPQTKADLHALLPGLDEVGLREFVRQFVEQLDPQAGRPRRLACFADSEANRRKLDGGGRGEAEGGSREWAMSSGATGGERRALAPSTRANECMNLPPGWESGKDPATGRTYYVDHHTQQTQWEPPAPTGSHKPPASKNGFFERDVIQATAIPHGVQHSATQQTVVVMHSDMGALGPLGAPRGGQWLQEKYCGPRTLLLGIFIFPIFPCLFCFPCDNRIVYIVNGTRYDSVSRIVPAGCC